MKPLVLAPPVNRCWRLIDFVDRLVLPAINASPIPKIAWSDLFAGLPKRWLASFRKATVHLHGTVCRIAEVGLGESEPVNFEGFFQN